MALGKIVTRMKQVGVLDQWNIAVMSDHGHSKMQTCIYPENVLHDIKVGYERATLLVALPEKDKLNEVIEALGQYGAELYPNDCVPETLRNTVFMFVAPEQVSFESAPDGVTDPTGVPKSISTHGLKPGLSGDDRFALFAGPDVPKGSIEDANATQIAPTLAKLLGLAVEDFPSRSIF